MRTTVKIATFGCCLLAMICIFSACEEVQDPQPPNTNSPKQIIGVAQAKTMFDTYTERRLPIIKRYEENVDSTAAFNPTRFGEYSYKTIKNYMAFIESEAALADVEIGGLRFYFTNYPDASTFSDGTPVQYPRQNSFVLVPTTEVDGEQQGFITRTTPSGGRKVVLIKDWLREQPQPDNRKKGQQGAFKATGAVHVKEGSGSLKPQLLFINPTTGIAKPVLDGEDVSLLLNESNLVPPPPQQETDFDD